MNLIFASKIAEFNLWQSLNTYSPKTVNVGGITIDYNSVQNSNAKSPINSIEFGKINSLN